MGERHTRALAHHVLQRSLSRRLGNARGGRTAGSETRRALNAVGVGLTRESALSVLDVAAVGKAGGVILARRRHRTGNRHLARLRSNLWLLRSRPRLLLRIHTRLLRVRARLLRIGARLLARLAISGLTVRSRRRFIFFPARCHEDSSRQDTHYDARDP